MVKLDELTIDQIKELEFSEKELKELDKARSMPITFDEECPETTSERALRFKRVNPVREKTAI